MKQDSIVVPDSIKVGFEQFFNEKKYIEVEYTSSNYKFPLELTKENLYVEKFAPIYLQDIDTTRLINIFGADTVKMTDFIETLRFYNSHYYRNINDDFFKKVKTQKLENIILPIYLRDFNEAVDTNVRYILKNNFSIVDIHLNTKNYYNSEFSFYIYDKKTNTRYENFYRFEDVVYTVKNLRELDKKGKLNKLTQNQIEKKIKKMVAKDNGDRVYGNMAWGSVVIFYTTFLATIVILNVVLQ